MHLRVRTAAIAGLLVICIPTPAMAQRMGAEEFYQRALKLKKKGAMAMFAVAEVKSLKREATAAGNLVKQTRLASEAAGKAPRYCPPKGAKRVGVEEFLNALGAIPAKVRQSIDMTEATTRVMEKKFPCSAGRR